MKITLKKKVFILAILFTILLSSTSWFGAERFSLPLFISYIIILFLLLLPSEN